jgi:hypothetical protein
MNFPYGEGVGKVSIHCQSSGRTATECAHDAPVACPLDESHRVKASNLTLAFSCGARISIQAEGKRLLEKHAIAPSAARPCWAAPMNKDDQALQSFDLFRDLPQFG